MIVRFEESFLKDIRNIRSATLKSRIGKAIDLLQKAESLKPSQKVKKLKGHHNAYRMRIGEYRIGLFMEGSEVILSRCLHRKDIYKMFPPE